MPVTLNIIESTTALGLEVVEVVLASASEPGPAGPGVPAGGTDGQVLTKASATDYDTAWEDATGGPGGGAPTDATYLVTAAHADLSAEVPVGATPGGELGGTWASPTVDATHSGSSHASTQAAAEATAAAALAAHVGAADPHTGYRLESVPIAAADVAADVATQAELDAVAAASVNDGDAAGGVLSGTYPNPGFAADMATQAELDAHVNDISAAHAASAVSADSTTLSGTGTDVQAVLEELDNLLDDHSARHEDGGADEISIQGLAGTPTELTNHLNDATDAHDASAISVLDSGANYTATDVEGVLAEIAPQLGGGTFVGARVERTTAQTITTATLTAVSFDAERFDTNAFHDNSTNPTRLTVPVGLGGTYLIGAGIGFIAGVDGTFRAVAIRVNGTTVILSTGVDAGGNSDPHRFVPVTLYQLADSDYVEIMVFHTNGSDLDVEHGDNFTPEFWITRLG